MPFAGIGISPGNGGLTTPSGGRFRRKRVARDNGHRRGPRRAAIWAEAPPARRAAPWPRNVGGAAAARPPCALALYLGIEMPNPLTTRWIIGVALAAVAVLGIVSVW